ncbi:MAG TPA: hypothetical protein VHM70_03380 [Polyangiaceae bacterium]|nr:hypothetical protein [Polyangiaceae bacterium]
MTRSQISFFALLTSCVVVPAACVNSDPVDDAPAMPSGTMTTPVMTSAPAESSAPMMEDTTMCGGTFDASGGVVISPNCTNEAPVNCNIVSFDGTTYTLGDDTEHWKGDTWDDGQSLTGGVYEYTADGQAPLVRELASDALHVTGTITAGAYAGFLFWFGPCQDAHEFDGVQFTISGTVGVASIQAQVQSEENYPLNTDDKGACPFTDDSTKWDECKNNSFPIQGMSTTSFSYYVPWANFTGGMPAATLSPNQLRGIQFQVDCPATSGDAGVAVDCPVDLQLYDLRFYRAHAAALAP